MNSFLREVELILKGSLFCQCKNHIFTHFLVGIHSTLSIVKGKIKYWGEKESQVDAMLKIQKDFGYQADKPSKN